MATMTSPANASEIPSWSIVGRRAAMNQSETSAARLFPRDEGLYRRHFQTLHAAAG